MTRDTWQISTPWAIDLPAQNPNAQVFPYSTALQHQTQHEPGKRLQEEEKINSMDRVLCRLFGEPTSLGPLSAAEVTVEAGEAAEHEDIHERFLLQLRHARTEPRRGGAHNRISVHKLEGRKSTSHQLDLNIKRQTGAMANTHTRG